MNERDERTAAPPRSFSNTVVRAPSLAITYAAVDGTPGNARSRCASDGASASASAALPRAPRRTRHHVAAQQRRHAGPQPEHHERLVGAEAGGAPRRRGVVGGAEVERDTQAGPHAGQHADEADVGQRARDDGPAAAPHERQRHRHPPQRRHGPVQRAEVQHPRWPAAAAAARPRADPPRRAPHEQVQQRVEGHEQVQLQADRRRDAAQLFRLLFRVQAAKQQPRCRLHQRDVADAGGLGHLVEEAGEAEEFGFVGEREFDVALLRWEREVNGVCWWYVTIESFRVRANGRRRVAVDTDRTGL